MGIETQFIDITIRRIFVTGYRESNGSITIVLFTGLWVIILHIVRSMHINCGRLGGIIKEHLLAMDLCTVLLCR